MTCDKYRLLLHDLLDGELPPRIARAMAEHETHCPYCAASRVEMREMLDGLANLDENITSPEEFSVTWRQMLRSERRPARARFQNTRVWIVAVAVLVIMFGGTGLMRAGLLGIGTEDKNKVDPSSHGQSDPGGTISDPMFTQDPAEVLYDLLKPSEQVSRMKILRSSAYTILTSRFDEDMQTILMLSRQAGGWVAGQAVSGVPLAESNDAGRLCQLQLRIPDESLSKFLAQLSAIGRVEKSQVVAEDFSEQYQESVAKLEGYESLMSQYREQLEQAADTDALYRLNLDIIDLQAKIDAARTNIQTWDMHEVFLQVEVTLTESSIVAIGTGTAGLTVRMRERFTLSLQAVGSYFRDMVIFAAAAAPWLMLAAALAGLALLIERLHWKSRQL